MSDISSLVKELKLDNLHKIVENGKQKFLCFTRLNGEKSLMVEVSDGIDIWLLDMDEEDMETQKDLNNIASSDAFLTKIRNCFLSGDISVARVGTKVTLTFGKGASIFSLDLFEARAADKKAEFQSVLFRMAENCSHLETQLTTANNQIDTLKAQKSAPGGLGALMDLSPKKGSAHTKAKQSKTGKSVINPTSRKRKAASGVVFGE